MEWEWRVATVPIEAIIDDQEAPDPDQEERLDLVRSAPAPFRPIYELTSGGKVKIIDGRLRLQVAKERGQSAVEALVGRGAPRPAALARRAVEWIEANTGAQGAPKPR